MYNYEVNDAWLWFVLSSLLIFIYFLIYGFKIKINLKVKSYTIGFNNELNVHNIKTHKRWIKINNIKSFIILF